MRSAGGNGPLDVYARAVVDHTADALEHDIGWLDRLIESEAQPSAAGRTGHAAGRVAR